MKPRSRAALSYLYKQDYHTIVSNQDSLTYVAKYDSYILIQILGVYDVVLESFCAFLSRSVQYVTQHVALLQGDTLLLLRFPLLQQYLPICQMETQSLFSGLSQCLAQELCRYRSRMDCICIHVSVCNCGEGGFAFLTMGDPNDVRREGFLLAPFSHLKAYSFGALYGRGRLIGIISGQFTQVVRYRSWVGTDFLPQGSVSSPQWHREVKKGLVWLTVGIASLSVCI